MTVPFKELAGSPIETYSTAGAQAERRILCAWEDRRAMAAELLGNGYEYGGQDRSAYPGHASLVATQVRIEPFHARPDDQGAFDEITAQLNSYNGQYAQLTVGYESAEAVVPASAPASALTLEPGTRVSYRVDFSEEQTVVSQLPDEAVVVVTPILEHHLTWHRVSGPPWDAIRASIGCVNEIEFLGAAAETLLFDGVKADREFLGIDDRGEPQYAWRLHYVFKEKAVKQVSGSEMSVETCGWNHVRRYSANEPPSIEREVDSAGNTLYPSADLSALFLSETAK
jgi:hypothetical protein